MRNLTKILQEVVKKYGKNELYDVPTIGWSNENLLSRYGEYQYWKNHIVVSNYLQSDVVSEKALEMVVYHEYLHQIYSDHTDEFWKSMDKFSNVQTYDDELVKYFETIDEWVLDYKHNLPMDEKKEIIYCEVAIDENNLDNYLEQLMFYNHMITGNLKKSIPSRYCSDKKRQVIFLVKYQNKYFVVGWAKDVTIFEKRQKADLTRYNKGYFCYQFVCAQKNIKMLLPCNLLCVLDENEIPNSLKMHGVCDGKELQGNINKEIVDVINDYASDFIELNTNDIFIDIIPQIHTENIDKLIEMSKMEYSLDRSYWIMNRAVEIERSFRTVYHRGLAFESCWLFDRALKDYEEARKMASSNEIKEIDERIKMMKFAINII